MKIDYKRPRHRDILALFRKHANQAVVVRYRIQPDTPPRGVSCVYYPERIDIVTYRSRVLNCYLLPVWEIEHGRPRMIPIEGILSLTVSGLTYEIDLWDRSIERPAPSTFEHN